MNETFHEALYYQPKEKKKVQCNLCPRFCLIPEGKTGFCRARINQKGRLYSLVYNHPCSIHEDPIEKKPLYHFLPGSRAFSIGTIGCNLTCKNCQNCEISQAKFEDIPHFDLSPEEIVKRAKAAKCQSIAYTYTEPTIFYEYVLETAKLARKKGLKNIMVTNGYINPDPAKRLYKYIDAANVDLKGYSEEFYRKICNVKLQPVLEILKIIKKMGVWLEVTNLIIPGYNDNLEKFEEMCLWVQKELGKNVPLHLSRFHPEYQMFKVPHTPFETLNSLYKIARSHLGHVYLGNVQAIRENNTYCPNCSELLIERSGFNILKNIIVNNHCSKCGQRVEGVWK